VFVRNARSYTILPISDSWRSMSCLIFDDSRSSCSSTDEDEVNRRVSPDWSKYRGLLESHGFRLDTFRDVKDFYHDYAQKVGLRLDDLRKLMAGYSRACESEDDNALCKDAGLVRNFCAFYTYFKFMVTSYA
jgi:hypothetical protein